MEGYLLAIGGNVEFWHIGADVYRSHCGDAKDIYGLPCARRWECSFSHWNRYRANFSWATDVARESILTPSVDVRSNRKRKR